MAYIYAYDDRPSGVNLLGAVGGIAEQPDVTELPSATAASGRDYAPCIIGTAGRADHRSGWCCGLAQVAQVR